MAAWWHWKYLTVGIIAICLAGGCSNSSSDNELADLELDEETSKLLDLPTKKASTKPGALPNLAEPPLKGDLGLRLAVGDRFPLQKRVEQRLTEPNAQSQTTGHSVLDLLLSLTVEELRDGQIRFAVKYHRVRYLEQDPEGRTIEYNSTLPARDVPAEARVYAGMVDNGFSFWIGPDNRLVDLVGFDDFVQRCVRDVPPNQRQAVVDQLTADKGENGIASFIDDSIGLLPVSTDPKSSGVTVQEGTSWDLPSRNVEGAVPLIVNTRCKIKGLTEQTAEIDLFGTITAKNSPATKKDWVVGSRGGRCMGSCTVDRKTGLPINSRVERYIDLFFELPDGTQMQQRKEIVTTIHAFLDQGHPTQTAASNIRPISHAEDTPAPAAPRPARPSSDDLRLFR